MIKLNQVERATIITYTNKNDNNKSNSEGKQTKNKKESYLDDYSAKEIEYAQIMGTIRAYEKII